MPVEKRPTSDAAQGNHIFISYARKDSKTVHEEIDWLKSKSHIVWFDQGIRPGEEWNQEIADAISSSFCFIYFITENSAASRNCRDELLFAQSNKIPVIAIHLEETILPGGLQLSLGLSQAILKYAITKEEYETVILKGLQQTDTGISTPVSGKNVRTRPSRRLAIGSVITVLVLAAGAYYFFNPDIQERIRSTSIHGSEVIEQERTLDPKSIAVLPFSDLSPERNQQYFADGLADTLVHVLGKIGGLKIAARASSSAMRKKQASIQTIGNDLSVAHILDGSLQVIGSKIRVKVELVEVSSGSVVWDEIYNGEMDDIFGIQDDIAAAVAKSLKVALVDATGQRLAEQYRPVLAAYEELIIGRHQMSLNTVESLRTAEKHFRRAIEIDPDYALAYVNLVDTLGLQDIYLYGYQDSYSALPSRKIRLQQQPLLDKALALDPTSGEAHASLARTQIDKQTSEENFLRAIELAPNYSLAYLWYSDFLSIRRGRYEEALEQIEKARRLDPISNNIRYTWIRAIWAVGRAEQAISLLDEAVRENPGFPPYYKLMARWKLQTAHAGEAMKWIKELRSLDPDSPSHWGEFGGECHVYVQLADPEASQECMSLFMGAYPESVPARRTAVALSGEPLATVKLFRKLVAEETGNDYRVNQLLFELVTAHLYDEIIDLVSDTHPELFEEIPAVNGQTIWPAMSVALAFRETEQPDRLKKILNGIQIAISRMRLIEGPGFTTGIEDVQLAALRGENDMALNLLRRAVDRDWRFTSDYFAYDPIFEEIAKDPRFHEMQAELHRYHVEQGQWYQAHKDEPLF